jgi:hypothetical protein
MKKEIQFQKDSYPIAVLLNIVPLLGTIKGILENLKNPLGLEFFILLILFYILLSNIIRLTKPKISIYVFGNRIEYFNMFGFKNSIKDEKSINIQDLRVIQTDIIKPSGAKRFITEVKALFNLKHGGQLKYKERKLFEGMK